MGDAGEKLVGIIGAIVALAVVAIVISARANTAAVLSSFFGGLSNLIGVAISPVTGQTVSGLQAGLTGGQWSGSGTSGFSLGSTYGVNVGGVGQIANVAGQFAGGLLNSVGGAYGYGGSIAAGSSGGTNVASSVGQDFVDSGTF